MKKFFLFIVFLLFSFLFLKTSPAWASTLVPTDTGRLSLIQVENGNVINQRDGSQVTIQGTYNLLNGRTSLRQAVGVQALTNVMAIPVQNNINLAHGTLAFWTYKTNWSSTTDDWFFREDVSTSVFPNDDLQVRKYGDGYLYAGFEFSRVAYPVSSLNPNTWHLIAMSWQSGVPVKLYIDGVFVAQGPSYAPYDGSAIPDASRVLCANICWGGWQNVSYANATMEDMELFNYVLSDQQILNIYNSQAPAQFYYHSPIVGTITAPTSPVQVSTSISTGANFTDADILDTHTALWDWGDGTTSSGTVSEASGSGLVTGSHNYVSAGVYTVKLTVTDNRGLSGSNQFQYVVVYDPNAGFVTGGGIFNSLSGALVSNPSATGNINFGFNAKYNNSTTPTGNTKFNFKAGNFNFTSDNYQWLVVSGSKSQLYGTGTVNGSGNYTFLLTITDGNLTGGDGNDRLRMKILDSNGNVVYDNQMGAPDTADPTTVISGGNIIIHQ